MTDQDPDLAGLWARALGDLALGDLQPQHRAFLRLTRPITLVEDTAVLAANNHFAKEVIETRLRTLLTEALSKQAGREIRIAVTVDESAPATVRRARRSPTTSSRPTPSTPSTAPTTTRRSPRKRRRCAASTPSPRPGSTRSTSSRAS